LECIRKREDDELDDIRTVSEFDTISEKTKKITFILRSKEIEPLQDSNEEDGQSFSQKKNKRFSIKYLKVCSKNSSPNRNDDSFDNSSSLFNNHFPTPQRKSPLFFDASQRYYNLQPHSEMELGSDLQASTSKFHIPSSNPQVQVLTPLQQFQVAPLIQQSMQVATSNDQQQIFNPFTPSLNSNLPQFTIGFASQKVFSPSPATIQTDETVAQDSTEFY
jgi:hypothetical protein